MNKIKWFLLATCLFGLSGAHYLFSARTYTVQAQTKPISAYTAVNEPSIDYVKAYVLKQANIKGVRPDRALYVLKHESTYCWREGFYDPAIPGDDGESIGCWQIHLADHPDVTLACAQNLYCSTDWALTQMAEGRINWWNTWKYRAKLYPNDPID